MKLQGRVIQSLKRTSYLRQFGDWWDGFGNQRVFDGFALGTSAPRIDDDFQLVLILEWVGSRSLTHLELAIVVGVGPSSIPINKKCTEGQN